MTKAPSAAARPPILAPPPAPRPGRSRRNLSAEAWRDRIVQTALVLGDQYGDDAITNSLVAASAGLSRAHLYSFFPSRPQLYQAVIDARVQRMSRALLIKVKGAVGAEAKVHCVVDGYFTLMCDDASRQRWQSELLSSLREAAAPVVGRALAIRGTEEADPSSASLVGHAVIAMAESAARVWADRGRGNRRVSIDAVVRLISEVLITEAAQTARSGGAGTSARTRRPRPGAARQTG